MSENNHSVIQNLKRNISSDHLRMALRIVIGVIVSVLIAQLLQLKFAASTCIVTLLGIQTTRKDTYRTAIQRGITLAYTLLIAFLIERWLGSSMLTFCFSVLLLTLISFLLGLNGTLSINIVVLVHLFLQQQPFTASLMINEVLRVVIGISVALLINRRMPSKEKEFIEDRRKIEEDMIFLLKQYAIYLKSDQSMDDRIPQALNDLKQAVESGLDHATVFANNELSDTSEYYLKYISMRQSEVMILQDIYAVLALITRTDPAVIPLAEYIEVLAKCVSVQQPLSPAGSAQQKLHKVLESEDLPATKEQLTDRMAIFYISESLEQMISVKLEFMTAITEEEKKRYWQNCENS